MELWAGSGFPCVTQIPLMIPFFEACHPANRAVWGKRAMGGGQEPGRRAITRTGRAASLDFWQTTLWKSLLRWCLLLGDLNREGGTDSLLSISPNR